MAGSGRSLALRRIAAVALAGALMASALVVAACGSGGGGGDAQRGVIRFTFAPDPVWRWLKDQGIKDEMEQKANIKILDSATWDEFGIYAGGNADIVSVASFEVPTLEQQTGIESVIFGKYNIARAVIGVPSDSPYKSLGDLKGKRITTFTAVSDALLWGAMGQKFENVDLKGGGGDFKLTLTDVQNMGPLVAKGDAEGCICLPDFAVKELKNDKLRVLYDGMSDAELFESKVAPNHDGPAINTFIARADWYETHKEEAAFFLKLWERGLKEWQEHKDEIIAAYPQDFAVKTAAERKFISDYLGKHDWFYDSVYLDKQWVDGESKVFDLLRETGRMAEDQKNPRFDILPPSAPASLSKDQVEPKT